MPSFADTRHKLKGFSNRRFSTAFAPPLTDRIGLLPGAAEGSAGQDGDREGRAVVVNSLRAFRIATFFQRAKFSLNMSTSKLSAPDLTQRPPRSPRTRLGGYVLLPLS